MTPQKRDGSPYWQIRPRVLIPGRGMVRLNARSTGTRDRRRAEQMEAAVRDLPMTGHVDVIEMLERGEVSVAEIYLAKLSGRLDDLRDPARRRPLEAAVRELQGSVGPRIRSGLENLLRLAPPRSTVADLADSTQVRRILLAREAEGVMRNSVRRSLYRAISELLQVELGPERTALILDHRRIRFPAENDERWVMLTPEEIGRLIAAPRERLMGLAIEFLLSTGIDRGPLLKAEPRHFDAVNHSLRVIDTKTKSRFRVITLGESAVRCFRQAQLLSGAGPADRVWPWTPWQFRKRFEAARAEADLAHVRTKDLRGVFATYWLLGGGSPRDLQAVLGHKTMEMTLRYLNRLPTEHRSKMEDAAKRMELVRHLRVEDGGAT